MASIAIEQQLDYELALTYLAKARVTTQQVGSPERQAYIDLNTGAAYLNLGRYAEAEASLKNGLEIAQRLQHEELIANLRRNLGRVAAANGRFLEAENDYKLALIAAANRGLRRFAASILLDIGKLGFQQHLEPYARRCFRDALSASPGTRKLRFRR